MTSRQQRTHLQAFHGRSAPTAPVVARASTNVFPQVANCSGASITPLERESNGPRPRRATDDRTWDLSSQPDFD